MLSDLLATVFERSVRFRGPAGEDARSTEALADALVSATGEGEGRALGGRILDRFDAMEDDAKLTFFRHLTEAMDIVPEVVETALAAYRATPDRDSYRAFMTAAEPPRQELIRRLNGVPGATGRLVGMRADLLRLMRGAPEIAALDVDFRHLFTSWFNRGFLVLRPINWQSPAHILEKIIAYEAVHAIGSWDDLRRRLQPSDRRCFAFFHPAMPDEPLIFVEVALAQGVPGSVQGLLSDTRDILPEEEADTAVFYSISNCQAGLGGISFGNSLIKQVASDLSLILPKLKTFVTLSPIPGFAAWLDTRWQGRPTPDDAQLKALAAYYLTGAKRDDGLPLDAVARFHLGNGARVYQVHAQADTSENGMAQSRGVMVNYHYDLGKVSANREKFAASQTVALSSEIRSLAASGAKLMAQEAK